MNPVLKYDLKYLSIIVFLLSIIGLSLSQCVIVHDVNGVLDTNKKRTYIKEGSIISEKRTVGDFSQIRLSGPYSVKLTKDLESGEIVVIAGENIIPFISIENDDGKLIITKKGDVVFMKIKRIDIMVGYKSFDKIEISGAGEVISEGYISLSNNLELTTKGAGNIDLKLYAQDVLIHTKGSGDITLTGNAQNVEIATNGAGDVDLYRLESQDIKVRAKGSGDIRCNGSGKLDLVTSDSGDIIYNGIPKRVDIRTKGSGKIMKRTDLH